MCAFDMTKKPDMGRSTFVPTNIVADEGQHYAIFSEYVELGIHDQATQKFPTKRPSMEAVLGFELTDQMIDIKTKDGTKTIPMTVNRVIPLSASDKSNSYKFFKAIGEAPTPEALEKIIEEKIKPKDQQGAPKIGEGAKDFTSLLGANVFLTISHGSSVRTFKDCYRDGTTAEEVKEAKETGRILPLIPEQKLDWIWNNFTPASVTSTFHPRYGYERCVSPENSKGLRMFVWDSPTKESYEALDGWMKDKIKAAHNYPGSAVEALVLSLQQNGDESAASNEHTPRNSSEAMDDVPF